MKPQQPTIMWWWHSARFPAYTEEKYVTQEVKIQSNTITPSSSFSQQIATICRRIFVSVFWRDFIAVFPSSGKTTHPEVQLNIMCLICSPNTQLSLEVSLKLVRICQWKNKIKIAINFHRDAITRDMVIASCSDVYAVVLIFFILLLLFCPCLEAFHELPPCAVISHIRLVATNHGQRWHQYGNMSPQK